MKKKINFISRKRLQHYNSIEELFLNISGNLIGQFDVNWLELPQSGASPLSILKNLRFVKTSKHQIYHITGDVNYMAIKLGSRSILTVHDIKSALAGSFFKKKLKEVLWFKWPANRVKYITVISEFTKHELLKLIPQHSEKIFVVYNPVNHSIKPDLEFKFNTLKPTVLLMGTKWNKNLERSIEALRGLSVKALIVGKLNKYQRELLTTCSIEFENHEQLSFEEVIDCYRKSDVLCFPSLYEGFGMPIIEAQAIGRPVLTSNHDAMLEVAANSACLVNPEDIKNIRAGLIKIIDNKVYREELIKSGFNNVTRFSLEKTKKAFADLYIKMI